MEHILNVILTKDQSPFPAPFHTHVGQTGSKGVLVPTSGASSSGLPKVLPNWTQVLSPNALQSQSTDTSCGEGKCSNPLHGAKYGEKVAKVPKVSNL